MPINAGRSPNDDDDPISDEELEEMSRRYDELEEDCKALCAESRSELEKIWRDLAGPLYDSMLHSKEETLKRFADPDPNIRRVAVHVAYDHWRLLSGATVKTYEKVALSDVDPGVRGVAFLALGACFAGTRDKTIGSILAGAACDDRLPEDLRMHAATALMEVHGTDYSNVCFPSNTISNDMDQKLIRLYLDGGGHIDE